MKNLKMMSMLLGGLMALGSLTACGGGDDDEPQPEKLTATSARAEYQLSVSQDLLDAASLTVYYIGDNGQQAQENLSQTAWTKAVSVAALPSQAGFSLQARLRGEPSKEEHTIEATGKMTITVLDQKGAAFGRPFVGQGLSLQGVLGPERQGQYLTRLALRIRQAKAITRDGAITDATIEWGGNADAGDPNRDTAVSSDGATGTTRSTAPLTL